METIVTTLTNFIANTRYEDLPAEVAEESKRCLLDSIGCALGSATTENGKMGLEFARRNHSGNPEASIIGFGDKVSCSGAAFANGEMMQALDYDAVTIIPPGHISSWVIPAALAVAESGKVSGKDLILATALAHEIVLRIAAGSSFFDTVLEDKIIRSPVFGMSCCMFGGVAAIGILRKLNKEKLANALGIAGLIAPTQSAGKWCATVPPPTLKYLSAGATAQSELTAVFLAEVGHKGDISVFETDAGFWRYIGSAHWDPRLVTEGLGQSWLFPGVTNFKPYPCAGPVHAGLECFKKIIEDNRIQPEEIEKVKYFNDWIYSSGIMPVLNVRKITNQIESSGSIYYGFAAVAFRIKPGPGWHDMHIIRDPKIIEFIDKVRLADDSEYPDNFSKTPPHPEDVFNKLSRVEVTARDKLFSEERAYAKGHPGTETTRMSNSDLADKFQQNAHRILPWNKIDGAINSIMELERLKDISRLTNNLTI